MSRAMMAAKHPHGLTPRLDLFCREYVVDFNGRRAARACGSPADAAGENASRWLSQDGVQVFIAELLQGLHARIGINVQRLMQEYETILLTDRRQFADENGRTLAPHELPADAAALIEGYEKTPDGWKYKLVSKRAVMRDLGESFAMFKSINAIVDARQIRKIDSVDPQEAARVYAEMMALEMPSAETGGQGDASAGDEA